MFLWIYKIITLRISLTTIFLSIVLLESFPILSFSFHHTSGTSHVLLGCAFFPQLATDQEPSLSKISRQWHNPVSTPKDLCHLVLLDKVQCLPLVTFGIEAENLLEPLNTWKYASAVTVPLAKPFEPNSRCVINAIVPYVHLWVAFGLQKKLGHVYNIQKKKHKQLHISIVLF